MIGWDTAEIYAAGVRKTRRRGCVILAERRQVLIDKNGGGVYNSNVNAEKGRSSGPVTGAESPGMVKRGAGGSCEYGLERRTESNGE